MARRNDIGEDANPINENVSRNDVQSVIERTAKLIKESQKNRQQIESTIRKLNDNFAV